MIPSSNRVRGFPGDDIFAPRKRALPLDGGSRASDVGRGANSPLIRVHGSSRRACASAERGSLAAEAREPCSAAVGWRRRRRSSGKRVFGSTGDQLPFPSISQIGAPLVWSVCQVSLRARVTERVLRVFFCGCSLRGHIIISRAGRSAPRERERDRARRGKKNKKGREISQLRVAPQFRATDRPY